MGLPGQEPDCAAVKSAGGRGFDVAIMLRRVRLARGSQRTRHGSRQQATAGLLKNPAVVILSETLCPQVPSDGSRISLGPGMRDSQTLRYAQGDMDRTSSTAPLSHMVSGY